MRWPAYPDYVDSGIDWLGEVPKHWDLLKLKRIAALKSGESINSDSINESDEYPVFGGNGFRGCTSTYTHDGHYALIGRQGALCGNINYANGKFWASEHAVVVSPLGELKTIWLGELLRAMDLNQYSVSAAQPGLSVDTISNLYVPRPPLEEQHTIAAFLDRETARIDTLIQKQQRLIELLQEKRQAVISHAVTKGLNPDVKMKDSGVEWLGEVPEHWEVKRLKFLAQVRGGVTKGRDLSGKPTVTLPYLRVANVQDGYLDLSEVATIEILATEVSRYRLEVGDVLMNEGGDFDKLGRGAVWRGEIETCLHQNHVFSVRPFCQDSSGWITMGTSSDYAKHYFILKSKQTTNLASISSTNIRELPVVFPPKEERADILGFLDAEVRRHDSLIGKAQSAIDLLKEHRTALISAAVTGKIDVRNAVSDAA